LSARRESCYFLIIVARGGYRVTKKDYDFSKGERGKFHRPGAKLNFPVYLDTEVQAFVQQIAENKHSDVSTVVNEILKRDIQLAEIIK